MTKDESLIEYGAGDNFKPLFLISEDIFYLHSLFRLGHNLTMSRTEADIILSCDGTIGVLPFDITLLRDQIINLLNFMKDYAPFSAFYIDDTQFFELSPPGMKMEVSELKLIKKTQHLIAFCIPVNNFIEGLITIYDPQLIPTGLLESQWFR